MADKGLVKYLAELAKINFTEEKLENMSKDMSSIINLMDTIKEINIDAKEFEGYEISSYHNLREDNVGNSFSPDDILKNAKKKMAHFVAVPKIVD